VRIARLARCRWFPSALLVACCAELGLTSRCAWGQANAAATSQPKQVEAAQADREFFETKIRPVLVRNCEECHSVNGASIEAGLRLDYAGGLLAGGESGRVIVPGDPATSRLLAAIRYNDESLQMPPAGPLSPTVVADFEAWIKAGAYDPRVEAPIKQTKAERQQAEARARWALKPPAEPNVPDVVHNEWCSKRPGSAEIDRFLVAKIEAASLRALPASDRHTLLRRATYDLTGLPPTKQEIADFEQDERPDAEAFAAVVDRLLNSPQYGVRWGRYWLDVVRYADTAGDNSDFPIPQMYRYRNWVIDALNRDLPYDEFIKQQLAGDLLPSKTNEEHYQQLIATGYLANSRRFGSRVDDYPTHLTIEDTIDNLGRAYLGLSVNCARCHDHKFDPISTEDYYGLYGFFSSTRYPWPGIELEQRQRDLVPLVEQAVVDAHQQTWQAKKDQLEADIKRLEKERDEAPDDKKETFKEAIDKAHEASRQYDKLPLPYPVAYAVAEGAGLARAPKAANVCVQIKGNPANEGPEVPRHFPVALGGQKLPAEETGSGRVHLANWIASPDNPLTARVIANRLWHYHFGVGLVATPNDFGKQGKPCSHPELLDWLARRLIQNGWSLKAMHRDMMLTAAYQRQAVANPAESVVDPENLLLTGYRRQRMSAEAIRDTLLTLSGELDLAVPEGHPFPPSTDWGFTQHNPFKGQYETKHRTAFLMTQRIQRHPFLAVFDGADPSASTPCRATSTTSLQALFFLNSPVVHQAAGRFATRLVATVPETDHRIEEAYLEAFGRKPSADEVVAARSYLAKFSNETNEQTRWESYVRILFRLPEFIHVD
jgi:Protein of unknown function (DUF1553)/Protein of unknown function (DUF1549)/Planctomycete cytochrome C